MGDLVLSLYMAEHISQGSCDSCAHELGVSVEARPSSDMIRCWYVVPACRGTDSKITKMIYNEMPCN